MREYFLSGIKEITVFMLCGQLAIGFSPGEKYGKYLRLLLEIMLLSRLVLILLSFIQPGAEENFLQSVAAYRLDAVYAADADADQMPWSDEALLDFTVRVMKEEENGAAK